MNRVCKNACRRTTARFVISLLQHNSPQHLQEVFVDYQLMESSEVPGAVWEAALIKNDDGTQYFRMDIVWAHLASMSSPDGMPRFSKLEKVAKLVLTLSHSNAEEERLFSMVRKNKSAFRPNINLDGTLSSILNVKLANSTSMNPPSLS